MKLKDALGKLKSQTGKPLKYFYCEKGADGNPVVLMGTGMPSNDEQAEILKKAQSKKVSRGSMTIDETGTLCIKPVGSAPSGLEKGVEKAAKLASAKVFNKVVIVEGNESEEAENGESPTKSASGTAPVIGAHRTGAPGQATPTIVRNEGYGNPQAPVTSGSRPAPVVVRNEGYGNPQAVPNGNASGANAGKVAIATHRLNPRQANAQPNAPAANGVDGVEYQNQEAVEFANDPGAVEYSNDPNAVPANNPGAVEYSNNPGVAAPASHPGVEYSNNPDVSSNANASGYDSSIPPGYEGGAPANARGVAIPPGYEGAEENASQANNAAANTAPKAPKQWADPLTKNSRMAELTRVKKEKQAELAARIAEVTANGATPSSEQQEELDKLQGLVDKIQAAMSQEILKQAKSGGATPKGLEAEYVGEDKKKGWLALPRLPGETDEQVAKRLKLTPDQVKQLQAQSETATSIRRNLTDKEKEDATIRIDEDGYARNSSGELDSQFFAKTSEFVADANTGDITKFTASSSPTGEKVLDQNGNLVDQMGRVHHSSVLGGEDALMAGSITTNKGEITGVSNVSGHYKPQIADMLQFLEKLMSQGALLDKEWLNADGSPLDGQAKAVYEAAVALQKKLPAKAKDEQDEQVRADLEVIKKAKAMLQKLGCAPSNKINPNAQVEFLGGTADMTGLQIKQAKGQAQKIAVKDFVQGGNNQKQVANKAAALQEMKGSSTKFQQANEQAEQTATKPLAKPVAEELTKKLAAQMQALDEKLAKLPEERKSEANELRITIAGLKTKLANLSEPTNEDFKAILVSLEEIKQRVLPAARSAPIAPPASTAAVGELQSVPGYE